MNPEKFALVVGIAVFVGERTSLFWDIFLRLHGATAATGSCAPRPTGWCVSSPAPFAGAGSPQR